MSRNLTLGVMFRRESPPEALPAAARLAEQTGFDALWLVEDCFYAGGLTQVAVALAQTTHISVGLGIMPGVARNPAFTAMEIAALARLYPGRFLPGLGHGVTDWMRQIGALPDSPLTALEEITQAVRALLHGETVTVTGRSVVLDQIRLEFPAAVPPPILLGVRGPKSLALSGRVADGTILAECSSPAYVAHARKLIAQHTPDGRDHRLVVYAMCQVDDDGSAARARVRSQLAAGIARERVHIQLEPLGIVPRIHALLAEGGRDRLEREMPDDWIEQLSVCGTVTDCLQALERLYDAGADSVVLVGTPGQDFEPLLESYRGLVAHFRALF